MQIHRDHLRRLDARYYRGLAVVHWSLTIRGRRSGWLSGLFYYRFRELLTHAAFRYGLACPIFCLMPDHFHLLWMGLFAGSDQLLAMKHFRKSVNESLKRIGFELQDQAYDHVLRDEERQEHAFEKCANTSHAILNERVLSGKTVTKSISSPAALFPVIPSCGHSKPRFGTSLIERSPFYAKMVSSDCDRSGSC